MNSHASMKEDHPNFYPQQRSTYPQPSLCVSEWSNTSEWITSSSLSSPTSPYDAYHRSPRPSPSPIAAPHSYNESYSYRPIEEPTPLLHYRPATSAPSPSSVHASERDNAVPEPPKIKRSPNAFLLFRSDFLKNKTIPASAERRQQNLSRVCGEVWNLASPEVKAKWQAKAAEALAAHQKAHPNYKFQPAARGTGKTRSKALRAEAAALMGEVDEKEMIRKLREQFVPDAKGPAIAPARRRRKTRKVDKKFSNEVPPAGPIYPRALSPPCTPTSPEGPAFNAPLLPPQSQSHFLHYSLPAPRRPSTSMGFTDAHRMALGVTRPSSASACELEMRPRPTFLAPAKPSYQRNQVYNATPTASTFEHIQQPTPMLYAPCPGVSYSNDALLSPYSHEAGSTFPNDYSFASAPSPHDANAEGTLGLRDLRLPYVDPTFNYDGSYYQEPYPLAPFELPSESYEQPAAVFNNHVYPYPSPLVSSLVDWDGFGAPSTSR